MDYNYSIEVLYSEIDEQYVAISPEFSNQMAGTGDTRSKAVAEAETALELLIEDYQEEGDELPHPRKAQKFSGNYSLRMPKSLHAQLSIMAEYEGVSINQYIISKLSYEIGLAHAGRWKEQEKSDWK